MARIISKLGLALLAALACAGSNAVAEFSELPGFASHDEFVQQANRTLWIVSEGHARFESGWRYYYIAYLTMEAVEETSSPFRAGPLWGEVQSLWKKRRSSLSPGDYEIVIIEARAYPGAVGSTARQVIYASEDGRWREDHVATQVLSCAELPWIEAIDRFNHYRKQWLK